ncbi:hypothetical protein [Streptomyces sp. ITFR-6]|uniref:hypothetical protein n=1 Tax=Streptomyces sp. ITFR-6 TaxID=3075197 RepID=UPI00288C4684|nr:hypothetical protein [Streptomyces sp. ITFR-6]WNI30761.1 hypothetical protein RLT59_19720 [Streptomyces sp. ITFR-6]
MTGLRAARPGLADRLSATRLRLDASDTEFTGVRAVAPGGLSRRAAQESVHEALGWLWDVVTEPVLAALGLDAPPPGPGSRPRPSI